MTRTSTFLRHVVSTLLVAASCTASAQTTVLVPSKQWNPSSVPKSPGAVSDAFSGTIDGIAWWANLYADKTVQADVRKMLQASATQLAKSIEWTGEGALLTVTMIGSQHPDSPFKAVGVLGDGVMYAGAGSSAEEALYQYWRTPPLRPAIPDGWTVHPLGETYLWVTLDGAGKPIVRAVPRGLAQDLDSRLRDNYGGVALAYARKSWSARDRWESIARKTKKQLASNEARKQVDTAMASILTSQKRVEDANVELKAAIERERRAASAMQTVKLLQGVLTVAQLIQEVRTTFNEPLPELSDASTAAAVINTVTGYQDGATKQTTSMQALFSGSLEDLQKFLNILGAKAKEAGAPPSVEPSLKIDLPPKA